MSECLAVETADSADPSRYRRRPRFGLGVIERCQQVGARYLEKVIGTKVQNKNLPIRKIVAYLNDDQAEGGGFWLPNIQRPFVWSEDQIARLFDSIMRDTR